ncbi:MAG: hypothetical protein H5U32_02445 [Pseudomonas balearica]|uniref:hypothetical protein n=1 Tax=Stutzerimonas balearica TaxID=74829 RepID=UPI0019BC9DE2|nr:hypothetical protein [Stutzerimonas balearica]MBC7198087.1 hypothetical protein [Stutzerimonas balearica]
MNEIQEVAEAIYDRYKPMWPLTAAAAAHLARMQMGDESHSVVSGVSHELFQLNRLHAPAEVTSVEAEAPEQRSILDRLDAAYQNLDRLPLDLDSELEAINDAEALIRSIHQVLDGKEWDSDTASDIAARLTVQGMVITEPRDDCELTADELQQCYADADGGWGEHPRYARSVWKGYVSCNDTQRGYWDWVVSMLEQEAD